MLLENIIKEYIYDIKCRNYTERTIKGYKNNLNRWFVYCNNELNISQLEEVNHIHIKKYLSFLKSKGLSESYINTILKNIRSFYNYCQKEEYCLNICKKVSWLKVKKTIIQTFTDVEVKKIINYYSMDSYINARNKCIMSVLIDTGIRCSELCNIKSIDVKETTIYIFGKGRKERIVPISPKLKKVMIKYERIRSSYLKDNALYYDNYFLSFRNRPLTIEAIERVVKLACNRIVRDEIRCSPHTCRHYYAQSQLRNGLDVYSLSRLLGHDDISITKRYLEGLQDMKIVELGTETSPLMNLK
ncbi:tyrosine-type recombinase/integrase [Terrisporobacter glycolicus]|uniref:tyrosine-type recombinase/integrase n=1 Tax=Terrisporobacter glycolicus TaxID=36841 RepID=UPI003464D3C1